jgi:hypothetical protein
VRSARAGGAAVDQPARMPSPPMTPGTVIEPSRVIGLTR